MKIARWPGLLSLAASLLLIPQVAHSATKSNKIFIYPAKGETVDQLQTNGVQIVKNYGAYWLAKADDQQVAALKASHGDRVERANYLNVIELGATALDTTTTGPVVPANLQEASGPGKYLRLIQFIGPVIPEWLAQVKAIRDVQIISYIPNNAYVVWLDAAAEKKLQKLTGDNGPIQWIGSYHPYYKLGVGLLQPATQVLTVRVCLVDDANTTATINQIAASALGKVESVPTPLKQREIQLTVNSASINSIAQIPGVLWIEQVRPLTTEDEKQDLIVATVTNGVGFGPAPGVHYIDFLTNTVGFSTSAAQYPVIDIADSGLDIGSEDPLHSDFYERGPSVSNVIGGGVNSRVAYLLDYTPCPDATCNPCPPGETCPPYPPYENCLNDGHDGYGHGTFVASIAIGYNDVPDITVPCVERQSTTVCLNTNITVEAVQPQTVCVPTQPTPTCLPVYLTNSWNIVGSSTNISVCAGSVTLVTNDIFVIRQDVDGFQRGMGVSPFGRIGVSKIFNDCDTGYIPDLTELVQSAYLNGSRIQNNSWGQVLLTGTGGNSGVYDSQSQEYDLLVRDALPTGSSQTPGPSPLNQEMVEIFAGGNAGASGKVGGFGDVLVTPPATAKNVISVGASENVRPTQYCTQFADDSDNALDIAIFSSVGGTEDGRFKPEIVAPGTSIMGAVTQFQLSRGSLPGTTCAGLDPFNPTDPYNPNDDVQVINDVYTCGNGTSFSTPTLSGTAQLLWWYFQHKLVNEDGRNLLQPSPAMTKAYICNSARYLPTTNPQTGVRDTLPSSAQGMGILDLQRMFDGVPRIIRDETSPRAIDVPLISTNPVNQQIYFSQTGQSYELNGQVSDATKPFRVTVAWTDAPANLAAFSKLVNDLDLQVTIGGATYKGNVFSEDHSITGGVFDAINNMESVFLPANTLTNGEPWRLIVTAHTLAGDGVPNVGNDTDQDFALVVYNAATNATAVSDIPNPATNDACSTAIPIGNYPYAFTNTLDKTTYHNTHPSPSCARGGVNAFWKVVTPTPGVTFNVDTTGSSFDTVVSVWKVQTVPQTIFVRGECGALVEVACNNDTGNSLQSALSFVSDGSNTYYIVVEPHNDGPGGQLILNVDATNPDIVVTPAALNFGEQVSGTTSAVQTVTYQNNTSVDVEIQNLTIGGANSNDFIIVSDTCNGNLLAPGAACHIMVAFAPTTNDNLNATLFIYDTALGSPRAAALSGMGLPPAPIVCSSTAGPLTFTNLQAVGTSSFPRSITLTNCGTANLTISSITVAGSGSNDFTTVGETCTGAPIAPGATCTIPVVFSPVTAGLRQGILTIAHDAGGSPLNITLQGTGYIPAPSVCASTGGLSFGGVAVGSSSAAQSVIITNCGTAPLNISGIGLVGANPGDFLVTSNACSVIATGAYCKVFVKFAPQESGVLSASLAVTNDASGSPLLISLTGAGLPAVVCLSTAPLAFTDTAVNTTNSLPQTLVVTNCGTADLVISGLSFTGAGSNDFFVATNETCMAAGIPANGTCVIPIYFNPMATGLRQATLNIINNADGGLSTINVRGTAYTPASGICLSRSAITFSNQLIGVTSETESVTITNCGTAVLTISGLGIVGVNSNDFAVVSSSCSTIGIGQTCKVFLTFTPTAAGSRTASLAITNNSAVSPKLVTLQGGGDNSQPDALIGKTYKLQFRRDGTLKSLLGWNIINTNAVNQTYQTKMKRGDRKGVKVYLAAHNKGTISDQFFVQGDAGSGGWSARYYLGATSTNVEVTATVTNGTFATSTLAPGAVQGDATMLRMEVFATTNVVKGATNTFSVSFVSTSDSTKKDVVAVQAITK